MACAGLALTGVAGCAPGDDDGAPADRWRPTADVVSWQYQLTGGFAPGIPADVYDVDPDLVDAPTVTRLQDRGSRVLCYLSVGSVEEWRTDAGDLPDEVIGEPLAGWPDERWLDVRASEVLLGWVEPRLRRCAAAGFDGVELDNIDAYANETGFPITADDELAYVRALVGAAHAQGLAVALKNAPELVPALVDSVDLAVVEECFAEASCDDYLPLVEAGRPVLVVEYGPLAPHCGAAGRAGFSLIGKDLDLGAALQTC